MKKAILTLVLSLFFIQCFAPKGISPIFIPAPDIISIYGLTDPLAHAVAFEESRFKPHIINKISGARGLMQITKIMIREVNRIQTRKEVFLSHFGCFIKFRRYTWNDAFDPYLSIEMWYVFQNYHNPEYSPVKACKLWFGAGVQYDGMKWSQYYSEVSKNIKVNFYEKSSSLPKD